MWCVETGDICLCVGGVRMCTWRKELYSHVGKNRREFDLEFQKNALGVLKRESRLKML